ncbi:MAG: hypothetical protein COB02_07695, partial [Candidatus Cloacimonadota bacterium]
QDGALLGGIATGLAGSAKNLVTNLFGKTKNAFGLLRGWLGGGSKPKVPKINLDFKNILKNTDDIRFTQDSIAGNFKDKGSILKLIAELKGGKNPSTIDPIRIFEKMD